ncbi:MAG: type II secretion system protein GspG [bacterium]|nr:type II secretion system protein GspG [bacterium]
MAIPNFLLAQTRSKVSRAQADMKSIGTALESYRVDNTAYPSSTTDPARTWIRDGVTEPWWRCQPWELSMPADLIPMDCELICLTTPVSYITQIYLDPFNWGSQTFYPGMQGNRRRYQYIGICKNNLGPGIFPYPSGRTFHWRLWSVGPKGTTLTTVYDPSNGVVSLGIIARFGP